MGVSIGLGCLTCKKVINLGQPYEPKNTVLMEGVFSELKPGWLSQEESYEYLWKFLFKHRHHELRLEWEWFWVEGYEEVNEDLSSLDEPEDWEPYEEWEALKRNKSSD
jgi:hypothetical protein